MPNHIFLWVWKRLNILHCENLVRAPSSSTADPKSMILIIKSCLNINSSNMHQYLFVCKHCWFVCALNDKTKSPLFGNYLVALRLTPLVQKVLPNRKPKLFLWQPVIYYLWTMIFSSLISLCVTPCVCIYSTACTTCIYIGMFFTEISEMTNYKIHSDISEFFLVFDTKRSKKKYQCCCVGLYYSVS